MGTKNPKIIVDDYNFNVAKKYSTRTWWICSEYSKTKCKARARTMGNMVHITGVHNHLPRLDKKKKFPTNMPSQVVTIIREQS